MTIHRFAPRHFHATLGAHEPVLRIADGDTVITTTVDAHGYDHENVHRGGDTNPMTGPFFVEGAEPGDTLAVTIERITPSRTIKAFEDTLASLGFVRVHKKHIVNMNFMKTYIKGEGGYLALIHQENKILVGKTFG